MAKKIVKDVEDNMKEVEKEIVSNEYEEITLEERIVNIEKKAKASFWLNIVTLVLMVFLLILLLGGGNATNTDAAGEGSGTGEQTGTQDTAYDTSAFTTITPSDIATLSKKDTMVVWIGRQSCGYCAMYAPYIAEAAKNYGITAYYIDLATMINFDVAQPYITDENAFNTLSSLSGSGQWKTFASDNIGGTPLTLIIKKGKVIGGLSGYDDTSAIEDAFKAAGLKK